MSKSPYLSDALLDHALGGGDYSRPATVYLALFTTALAEPDGTGGIEVGAGDYARLAITNDATSFPAASSGSKTNGIDFAFPIATNAWGTIVSWALYDAVAGGNLLHFGDFDESKAVGIGDRARVNAGDMTITEG